MKLDLPPIAHGQGQVPVQTHLSQLPSPHCSHRDPPGLAQHERDTALDPSPLLGMSRAHWEHLGSIIGEKPLEFHLLPRTQNRGAANCPQLPSLSRGPLSPSTGTHKHYLYPRKE